MAEREPHEAPHRVAELINRLGLAARSLSQSAGLAPAQWDALRFLGRANRYSRKPSAVADFLGATRGTTSQTLLTLAHKALIERRADLVDHRIVRLELTEAGRTLLAADPLHEFADALVPDDAERLAHDLLGLLLAVQRRRGHKSFGVCQSCRHFRRGDAPDEPGGPHRCGLTLEPLSEPDSGQICAEHTVRAA